MITALFKILFSLILIGSNEKIDITDYLQKQLTDYNKIEYTDNFTEESKFK